MEITLDVSKKGDIIQWLQNNEQHKDKQEILLTALSIGLQSIQLSETSFTGKSYIKPIEDIANETKSVIQTMDNKLNDIFHLNTNSSHKGKLGETVAIQSIMKRYPSWEIKDTTGVQYSGDFHAKNTPIGDILYEIKNYDYTVNKDQITKFYRDLDNTGIKYGIFISHTSGIVGKKNIEWEIKSNKLCIFVSNMGINNYSTEIATELLMSLISMDIMGEKQNYVLKYNIDVDGIIDTLNDHICELKTSLEYIANHRQIIIEQTKKINDNLYAIERSVTKCETHMNNTFHKLTNYIQDISIDTDTLQQQNRSQIINYIESLDDNNKSIFYNIYSLCTELDIDILLQKHNWIFMKDTKHIGQTKITQSKLEIMIPITTKSITLNINYEKIKNNYLVILMKDQVDVLEIIKSRFKSL